MKAFRSLMAMLMSFVCFSAFAVTPNQIALKQAFDEFHYALSVDWDQKDQAFFQAKSEDFNQSLTNLMKQGLTKEDLIGFAKSEIKDAKQADEIVARLNRLNVATMTEKDLSKTVLDMRSSLYSNGASWQGAGDGILIGLGVVALLGFAVWFGLNYHCARYNSCGSIDCYSGYYVSSCSCNTTCDVYVPNN